MDRFNQISFNKIHRRSNDYSNFGEDMYGTSVKIPVHSYQSLYSKQPIYFTDYGSGGYPYPVYGRHGWRSQYYAKPEGGGIWAADGNAGAKSGDSSNSDIKAVVLGGVIGAAAGYFIAKSEKKNLFAGALIGGGAIAGIMMLLNTSE